jgi:BirA family biotin operon repressor/biotin-[acetyl-CoA-carboxylase] ligase
MGVNVRIVPEGAGQPATSLLESGAADTVEPAHLLDRLRPALSARIDQARADFPATLSDWLDRAEGLGREVEAGPPEARQTGIFEGLAEDGGLILRLHDGTRKTIRAGDVQLVKEA